jgi:hypothetical protein
LALSQRDAAGVETSVSATRLAIVAPLSAASRESYRRSYRYFIQLHMLGEVEYARDLMLDPASRPPLSARRLDSMDSSFRVREPVLSLRRVLLETAEHVREAGSVWLDVAKEARQVCALARRHHHPRARAGIGARLKRLFPRARSCAGPAVRRGGRRSAPRGATAGPHGRP